MDDRDYSGDGYRTVLSDWPEGSTEAKCIRAGDAVFLRGPKEDFGNGVLRHPVYIKPKNYIKSTYTPRPLPAVTTIYFIGCENGPIKIGMASRVSVRLRMLQLSSPVELTLMATVEGPPSLEREYHKRFAAHRLHGEWFSPHPDILAEIARLSPNTSASGVVG